MPKTPKKSKRIKALERKLENCLKDMFACVVGPAVGQTRGFGHGVQNEDTFKIAQKLAVQEFATAGVFKEGQCELVPINEDGRLKGAFLKIDLSPFIQDEEITRIIHAGHKYVHEYYHSGGNKARVLSTIADLKNE